MATYDAKRLRPDDPRVTNAMLRRIHNVCVVQSRTGWTKAEALEAITAANRGETYPLPEPRA